MAEKTLKLSIAPLPRTEVVRELVRLKAKTANKNMSDEDLRMQLEVYAEELQAYPADCVIHALKLAGSNEWFPTWSDLERILSPMVLVRKSILREVQKLLSPTKQVKPGMHSFGELMKAEG
ncbi:hypothetical protein [Kiloniella majae]|uniref:hypothetical protein n=1 Tax=Kiloniella majae TaxID=1938558 RepID=UPI000A2794CD|nr:hypothetical protein [Kiloniella majae]